MRVEMTRSNVEIAARYSGAMIRYAFYAAGVFAFLFIGLVASWTWKRLPPSPADVKATPVFEIATNIQPPRPPVTKAENNSYGWVEMLQYGQLYDRDSDLTMVMIVPKDHYQNLTRSYASEIASLRPIAGRGYSSSAQFYDLETRFGSARAAEFSINADGRTKLCISYLSRFESPAFYVKGWYCEANGARPSYRVVACMIDQLALRRALPSTEATAFITERMKRPAKCLAEPVSQTTDTGGRRPLQRLIR